MEYLKDIHIRLPNKAGSI